MRPARWAAWTPAAASRSSRAACSTVSWPASWFSGWPSTYCMAMKARPWTSPTSYTWQTHSWLDTGLGPGLGEDALGEPGVVAPDELEGGMAAQPWIIGEEDLAHAALAEEAHALVALPAGHGEDGSLRRRSPRRGGAIQGGCARCSVPHGHVRDASAVWTRQTASCSQPRGNLTWPSSLDAFMARAPVTLWASMYSTARVVRGSSRGRCPRQVSDTLTAGPGSAQGRPRPSNRWFHAVRHPCHGPLGANLDDTQRH